MKKISLFLLFISVSLSSFAQTDHPYQFEVTNLPDTTVYLANYYGEKLYYADTTRSVNGKFSFKKVKPAKEGKFAVVIPGPKYFEIIIADGENIRMQSDTADLVKNLKVIESKNNEIMYDYVNFISEKKVLRDSLSKELEANEGIPQITSKIKERYNALNDEVLSYQRRIADENPDYFISKEIRMSLDVEPPAELREDRQKAYYYFKENYFDNIDLQDDRIVNTPIFHTRFVNFLNTTLIQDPDTVIAAFDKLAKNLDPKSEVFKYTVHYTTYNAETSKIMGMDKVFVHMVDTYYTPGQAYWLDEEKLQNIKKKADEKRKTLIGKKVPELILADTNETWISTHRDIKNKYVVLFFYDPDCGHCKKEVPKLVDFYKNYDGDVAVYAISSDNDEKWNKFIRKNDMTFYNVSIPAKAYNDAEYATNLIMSRKTNYESLKYSETFDIFSTPKVFILDENRVIKAKDIGVEQIEGILNRLREMDKPVEK